MTKQTKTVKFFTNDYDVDMLELTIPKKYPVRISVKKALAILDTNQDGGLIEEVQKHGRTLFSITYKGTKKSFTIGMTKIDTVLSMETEILLGLHANIDSTKEA